eukprot:gene15362-4503_t
MLAKNVDARRWEGRRANGTTAAAGRPASLGLRADAAPAPARPQPPG